VLIWKFVSHAVLSFGRITTTRVGAALFLSVALNSAMAQISLPFSDDFQSSTLNPAWQQLPGSGSVSVGGGQLVYSNIGSEADTRGWYSPALTLALPFAGTTWTIETKATYSLQWDIPGHSYTGPPTPDLQYSSGAQGPEVLVSFNPGTITSSYGGPNYAGTDYAFIERDIDAAYGSDILEASYGAIGNSNFLDPADATIQNNVADGTYWYRITRNAGDLTIMYSRDGVNYSTALTAQLANPASTNNELLLGGATFSNAGSYTVYSYVHITGPQPPLQITTTSLAPPGIGAGLAYNSMPPLTATGGTGTGYTWCVLVGSAGSACDPNPAMDGLLPAGFSLTSQTNGTGLISAMNGNAAVAGAYNFTAQVTDSGGATATRMLTLVVSCQVNPGDVQPYASGDYSRDGKPTTEFANFVPTDTNLLPVGLQAKAAACNFTKFNWQQAEVVLPTPQPISVCTSGIVLPNGKTLASILCTFANTNPTQPVVGSIPYDPVQGGYTYENYNDDAFPFYWTASELSAFSTANTLGFKDIVTKGVLSSVLQQTFNFTSTAPAAIFSTSLVGELPCGGSGQPVCGTVGQVSSPLFTWRWQTTFDGTTGGISPAKNINPIDPDSGTGGVELLSVNGVPSPTVSVDPSAGTINYGTSLSVAVSITQFDREPVPAGTVTLSSGSYTSSAATLDGNGDATFTIPAGSLPVGSDVLTSAYIPSATVSASYSVGLGTASVTVNALTPQITFAPNPNTQTYGTPITAGTLDAIAQANGSPVIGTFSYTTGACGSGPALTAGTTILDTGSYSITACFTPTQTGFATSSATALYSVTPASQSINFGPIPTQSVGATLSLNATATSGLPVSLQSLTPAICSVSGNIAAMLSAGTCTIQATQGGGLDYNPAAPVSSSFSVIAGGSFTLTATPKSETIKRGVLGAFLLQAKSVNGFAGNVSISCAGGPSKSACANFPDTVKLKANSTALALSGILFQPKDAAGTYTITFTGVSGMQTGSTTAQFIVK